MLRYRLLLLALLAILTTHGQAQRREALLIASRDGDAIHPYYRNVLLKDKGYDVHPGDTLRVPFDENSFLPTTIRFARESHNNMVEQPVLLVLPGDVITVRYNQAATAYAFTGRYPAELQTYHDLWRGSFSLGDLGNWGSVHYQSDSLVWMPPTLEEYMRYWQRLRRTGDSLVAVVHARPGIRPAVAQALTRELQLRTFVYLLKGIRYHVLYPANAAFRSRALPPVPKR